MTSEAKNLLQGILKFSQKSSNLNNVLLFLGTTHTKKTNPSYRETLSNLHSNKVGPTFSNQKNERRKKCRYN
jgi:hypothetical protein